jgi:hypothetical protein
MLLEDASISDRACGSCCNLMSDTEVIATKTLDERESISQGMEMSE